MFRLLWVGSLLAPAMAQATPMTLALRGHLVDETGAPVEGQHEITFALYPDAEASTPAWSVTEQLTVRGGDYTVLLSGIEPDALEGAAWLAVQLGDVAMEPRQALTSAPYSLRAAAADRVRIGVIDEPCTSGTPDLHGTLRFVVDHLEICTAGGWTALGEL